MPVSQGDNPLLGIQFRVPFDRIRAEHVEPAIDRLLEDARKRLDDIAAAPGPRTFQNTLDALDVSTEPLDYAAAVVRHLESVATYPEFRAAFNAIEPKVSEFHAGVPLNEALWRAIQDFNQTPEAGRLTGTRRRFLVKTVQDFRRHGAELDPAGKARLKQIDVELAQLTTRYSENVLDSTNAFELVIPDEKGLAGLPETARQAARESATAKGLQGWRFTLQAPSYVPLMTYLDDAAVRRQVYLAYMTRASKAPFDNPTLIARILELRREKAALLGYANFADLVLEDRMAHSGRHAREFLDSLHTRTLARFREENAELLEFRRQLEGPGAPELQPWDVGYYAEKQRQALYDFQEEELRPYFPVDRVIQGLFEIARRLYGVRIVEQDGVPVWDPQTRYYQILDKDGTALGSFYADWFPRENKRGGAWMDALITGVDGKPHLGLICGNLTPPLGGKPALLTHREAETIFHEFGHLIHHCLSKVEVRSLAGTHVAWDFVELPSQIMENWCWERPALDLFARHYETGEPIPEELFQKMRRARNFRSANAQMRQLGFGIVDLALHMEYRPERDGDVMAYARNLIQQFSPAPLPPEHAMMAGFTHLFGDPVGYAAGYYSYKWAEVLDADAFTRFQREGVFDARTGADFRARILERGDSEDPAQLYRDFMGRDPDVTALLERAGLGPGNTGSAA